jgi:hypothetical protein
MQILPQQPRSIAKILDASFSLFAASFTRIIGIGMLIAAMYTVLTLLSVDFTADLQPGADPEAMQGELFAKLPAFIGAIAAVSLLSFIFYGAIIYRIDNLARQREDTFGTALAVGLRKFPAMLLAVILYTLAVAAGTLLLVVPGVALMVSLSFYPLFIVVEDLGGYAALKASHRLVWGHWWRTLSVYMAPGILMLILYAALALVTYPLSGEADQSGSISAGDVLTNLLSGLAMPYFYALAYVLYHDLKLRKSGGDLAARLSK